MDYRNKGDDGKIVRIANRSHFDKYLKEASRYKPLTKEEEVKLFKQYSITKDQAILDKVCKHNLLFVVTVARHYAAVLNKSSTIYLEDLINEGNVGLCIAATRFDYKTENKFISYAVWWIKQTILKCLDDNLKSIRVPSNNRPNITAITKKQLELEQKNNSELSLDYVIEQMLLDGDIENEKKANRLNHVMKMNKFEKSLNSYINDEDKTEIIDLLAGDTIMADERVIKNEKIEFVRKMIGEMDPKIAMYIIEYYGINESQPLTIKEIAEKYNDTHYNVRQAIKKEIRKARIKNKNIVSIY
jgi:RNA polymerase primary sigma factor